MPHRYKERPSNLFPFVRFRPFAALREKFREGYDLSDFRGDLLSGMVVAMVAIPLGMALAIASGVPPQHGLYTVIIGGGVVALLGGSRFQVTGPTAAFVVILAPIAQKFGVGGLLLAGLMAGVMLALMGMARMGRLIQFIPYPVTTGFTAGIAVVIGTLQLKDFFGLRPHEMPEKFPEKVVALFHARGTLSWIELAIGALTLLFLVFWPKINRRIPAPLVALTFAAVLAAFLKSKFPDLEVATIGNRFSYVLGGVSGHGIPPAPPQFSLPWNLPGPDGKPFALSLDLIQSLLPAAFAITMLGAIESLLSAVVADGMAQTKHDPDAELIALGAGNILCPFFGGIAATGAIARTATNIRFGAKSPLSAMIHALVTFVVVLLFARWVSYLPMAALAALLMLVAYNMAEIKHFFHILKAGPKSDVSVLLMCFSLTVVFDMVVGVSVGIVLAAFLFMQKMAAVTSSRVFGGGEHPHLKEPLPKETVLYEIAGPLFFGATENAVEAMSSITDHIRSVIFVLDAVPFMDVTGLVAFESAIQKLIARHRQIYLVGVKKQPSDILKKSDLFKEGSEIHFCKTLDEAVQKCKGGGNGAPDR